MGLDAVELVMDVEEHFGVTITDEEAGSIRTVGDLLDLLEARVVRRESSGCLSLPWFLRLRRLTRDVTGREELRLRPSMCVDQILNRAERQRLWVALADLLGTAPPGLVRPKPLGMLIGLMVLAPVPLLIAAAIREQRSLAIAGATTAFCAWLLMVATRPMKATPPVGYVAFGDITQRLVGLEAAAIGYPGNARGVIFSDLALLVSTQLGVDIDEVTPEARFVEDLNIG